MNIAQIIRKSLVCLTLGGAFVLGGCMAQPDDEAIDADLVSEEDVAENSQALAILDCWYDASNQLTCEGPGSAGTWAYGFYPSPGYQFPAYPSGNKVSWFNCRRPIWAVTNTVKVQYWSNTGYYGQETKSCGY